MTNWYDRGTLYFYSNKPDREKVHLNFSRKTSTILLAMTDSVWARTRWQIVNQTEQQILQSLCELDLV